MYRLRQCYDAIQSAVGLKLQESFEVVEAVENHRLFWKPTTPRVLLLAESHVLTREDELTIPMSYTSAPPDYPRSFVRFVYCVGYGEQSIASASIVPNVGTWQFWQILNACRGTLPFDILKKKRGKIKKDIEQRLEAKFQLLNDLKAKRVWLVDASITALYWGKTRCNSTQSRVIIQTCWDHYIGNVIVTAKPEKVIVIGKGVAAYLDQRLKATGLNTFTIHQPQARNISPSDRKIELEMCTSLCQ